MSNNAYDAAHLNGCSVFFVLFKYTWTISLHTFYHTPPLLLYLLVCEATNKTGYGGWRDLVWYSKSKKLKTYGSKILLGTFDTDAGIFHLGFPKQEPVDTCVTSEKQMWLCQTDEIIVCAMHPAKV